MTSSPGQSVLCPSIIKAAEMVMVTRVRTEPTPHYTRLDLLTELLFPQGRKCRETGEWGAQ